MSVLPVVRNSVGQHAGRWPPAAAAPEVTCARVSARFTTR